MLKPKSLYVLSESSHSCSAQTCPESSVELSASVFSTAGRECSACFNSHGALDFFVLCCQ